MRPDDFAIAMLLFQASWQVRGVGHQFSPVEREQLANAMRDMAQTLLPPQSDSMAGAAEHYRPGVYNGD